MSRSIAENRKARHNYFIDDTLEAGLILTGTEVKSLRAGQASIGEAYAVERDGDLVLINAHISEYKGGNRFNHDPLRPRQLLLHKREITKLTNSIARAGVTVVPLKLYFNDRGIAKILLGIAKGKKQHDKRATSKDRDWKRDQGRLMRDRS
ncbi:MAG: SsrA-binding protein SmpB [Rhodospirillaceae bacterium]|jgi:SsrA-binding protein|nr:SsrA-binding protein SmpB [Rhodospirillaceae bacterium]MBT4690154.1 SsrA-binding protein SmpB [Rhodospirillaceae bacterium]MBT5080719.1 SsrA-binding protein SmpB [Rhodospirillaceae bacterium]MBT5524247.1 SsrA-binding protein SmpB [Rhodospirillaceae bacterium]MBT5877710.1 SsrA-binding protein SmpB [Rhodospirillaceae bacterium]